MLRGGVIIAVAIVAGAAWALARVNRDIDQIFGDVVWLHPEFLGMETGAESFGAGSAKVGAGLRVTNANQTRQTSQTHSTSKPRITSGQEAI